MKMLRCPALWTSFPYLSNGDKNAFFTGAVRFKCSSCSGFCSDWHILGAQKYLYLPLHLPSGDISRSLSTHTWLLIKYQITTMLRKHVQSLSASLISALEIDTSVPFFLNSMNMD